MDTLPVNPSQRAPSRARALLLIMIVFVLGAASGVGGGLLVLRRVMQRSFASDFGKTGPAELLTAALENQIAAEVAMTPAERAAIKEELEVTMTKFRNLRLQMRGDAREIVKDTVSRVEQHLPPEKRGKLREKVTAKLHPWGLAP